MVLNKVLSTITTAMLTGVQLKLTLTVCEDHVIVPDESQILTQCVSTERDFPAQRYKIVPKTSEKFVEYCFEPCIS